MAKAPPGFYFFVNDWCGGTRHLPLIARAAYLELLCFQWQNRTVPNSAEFRQNLWGVPTESEKYIWSLIRDKFDVINDAGSLANPKMLEIWDEEIPKWKHRKAVNKANGNKLKAKKRKRSESLSESLSESEANRGKGKGVSLKVEKSAYPTLDEWTELWVSKGGNRDDAEPSWSHYEANGWKQSSGNQIKKWNMCVVTCLKRQLPSNESPEPTYEVLK